MNDYDQILPYVQKPSRYLGHEVNAVKKDLSEVEVKVALAFPDLYEIGMSNLGLKILYHILNSRRRVAAERVFIPGEDYIDLLQSRGLELCSHESKLPLSRFDIVGFTLQYELSYTNILFMMRLGGIPLRSEERGEEHPFVIGGGPSAFNPEPVADFFDALVLGDGEEVILEIVDAYQTHRLEGGKRADFLSRLAAIEGVYVPSLYRVEYSGDGEIRRIAAIGEGPSTVTRRFLDSLDEAPYPMAPVVPFTDIVHDRISVEVARGCTRGCRFCQAGSIYRPVRQRSPSTVKNIVRRSLASTGYEEVSLSSLSIGDYSGLASLVPDLMTGFQDSCTALSFPSLRPGTLDPALLDQISRVRKTGFTLAPEAGTRRLRQVINKDITDDMIMETLMSILKGGWDFAKLYFMIGLPTEREEDLEAIVLLCRRIMKLRTEKGKSLRNLHIALSSFVPKAHTPFQWLGMERMERLKEKQENIRKELRGSKFTVKWHKPEMSYLEAVFARGDRRLAPVLEEAVNLGCRFDGWSDRLRFDDWLRAFSNVGLDPDEYAYRSPDTGVSLPWDHLNPGVDKAFLRREYERSLRGEITPDCIYGSCDMCGVKESGVKCPVREEPVPRPQAAPVRSRADDGEGEDAKAVYKYRMKYFKGEQARFLSHLEIVRAIHRASRRACLPLEHSRGYHPHPKVSFSQALPVGTESVEELMDMTLKSFIEPDELKERINRTLPPGLGVTWVAKLPFKSTPLPQTPAKVRYTVYLGKNRLNFIDETAHRKHLSDYLARDTIVVTETRKGRSKERDIRPLIESLILKPQEDRSYRLDLMINQEGVKQLNPWVLVKDLYSLEEIEARALRVVKTDAQLTEAGEYALRNRD